MDRQIIPNGVRERKQTSWHNPTKHAQSVIIRDGVPFAFVVQPGETQELDSRYDRAVQVIDCGKDECHKHGWFCTRGHDGNIVGGGAPLLRRVGKSDKVDSSLDPEWQARKSVEEEINREAARETILAGAREKRAKELEEANKAISVASSGNKGQSKG